MHDEVIQMVSMEAAGPYSALVGFSTAFAASASTFPFSVGMGFSWLKFVTGRLEVVRVMSSTVEAAASTKHLATGSSKSATRQLLTGFSGHCTVAFTTMKLSGLMRLLTSS